MDITPWEWITLLAILDGPVMAVIYLLWRRMSNK